MEYPNSLKNLIESLKKLPTIGEKSAERLAFAILSMDEEDANLFSESIIEVKKKIRKWHRREEPQNVKNRQPCVW